ncbi:Serine/threonine-protein kinase UCN [Abeliophyllum distichum]|uniref:non-specific serine/threonine protein kinase n=1 Tax=Abeliophyllum distichum TaxID=126358 RepID=A0ABD1Q509_9LAMI
MRVSIIPDVIMQIMDVDVVNGFEQNVRAKESCFISIMGLALECTDDLPEERLNMKDEPQLEKKGFNNNKKGLKKVKSACVSAVSTRNPIEFSSNERSNSFAGTEEYMAPKIITGAGHEYAVDRWALGVLCYEMLYGSTPFKGKNRKETFHKNISESSMDLIGKLLEKHTTRRLGYRGGTSKIEEHEFF